MLSQHSTPYRRVSIGGDLCAIRNVLKKAEGRRQKIEANPLEGDSNPSQPSATKSLIWKKLPTLAPLPSTLCRLPSAFLMKRNLLFLVPVVLFPLSCSLFSSTANALPGESAETVAAWMNANPTLRPEIGQGLRVTKRDTAAMNFTFQASVLPPGRVTPPEERGIIRSERMTFYDKINGVTFNRLREALRAIYDPIIYQDYDRARVVYEYPTPQLIDLARRQNRPLLAQQQGELRLGERYAYWLEVTKIDGDKAYNGQVTVFLRDDVDKLASELRDR